MLDDDVNAPWPKGTGLVPVSSSTAIDIARPLPEILQHAVETAEVLTQGARATSTNRFYASDWRLFTAWCAEHEGHGALALPAEPEILVAYLGYLFNVRRAYSTVVRKIAAIRAYHLDHFAQVDAAHRARKRAGEAVGEAPIMAVPTDHPLVRDVLAGYRRRIAAAQVDDTIQAPPPSKPKAALLNSMVARMVSHCPATKTGLRDRALLLVGFAGAFRRSELVAIRVEHLTWTPEGVTVTIPKSKTDQEGGGQAVAIPNGRQLRPVDALLEWLQASSITEGPVFRCLRRGGHLAPEALDADSVARLVKDYAKATGLDPVHFSGHSLRSGFLTSAALAGANVLKMVEVSRHRKLDTLKGYVQAADRFRDHAGDGFL